MNLYREVKVDDLASSLSLGSRQHCTAVRMEQTECLSLTGLIELENYLELTFSTCLLTKKTQKK